MKKLIFATGNENKVREIKMIMADMDYEIISLKEAGIEVDIEEDGMTFEENAVIKATVISKMTGELVLADDSGLEVDYLDKQPGIYSARYEGVDTPYTIKNQIIIDRLEGVAEEQRTARFVCAIAAAFPDGRVLTRTAAMEGRIDYEQKGENGFGYDPIFYLPQFGCTSAQLSPEHKNAISHRGKALRMMREALLAEDRNALNMEDIPPVPVETVAPAAGEQETAGAVAAMPKMQETTGAVAAMPEMQETTGAVAAMPEMQETVESVTAMPKMQEAVESVTAMPEMQETVETVAAMPEMQEIVGAVAAMPEMQETVRTVAAMPKMQEAVESVTAMPKMQETAKNKGETV